MMSFFLRALFLVGVLTIAWADSVPPIVSPTSADKALAARARAAVEAFRDSPARETANRMDDAWQTSLLPLLAGEKPATSNELAHARAVVAGLTATLEKGNEWPRPQRITVPHAQGAVQIDGKLDETAWQHAWTMRDAYRYNERVRLDTPVTAWRMLWDKRFLYVAVECEDAEIVAPKQERDAAVYENDCVEIFLRPDADPARYWELIFSPGGSLFDALHTKKLSGLGFEPGGPVATMESLQFATQIQHDPAAGKVRGYTMEIAIPFAQLPGAVKNRLPQRGDKLHIMLARFDRTGNQVQHYSFVPLLNWGHNIWNHAPVVLGPPLKD